MIPPQQCSSHITAVSVQTHKGSAKTPIRESPSAVTRSKLNTIFAFSCCWQRETILSVLTLCSRVNPCSDWGISGGWKRQMHCGDAERACAPCDCDDCSEGVSARRGEACEFGSLIRCVWLWMNILCKCHCLVALDTCLWSSILWLSGAWATEKVWFTICESSGTAWKPLPWGRGRKSSSRVVKGRNELWQYRDHRKERETQVPTGCRRWPGQWWRTEPGQDSALTGQQHTGLHCGQTQPLTINKNKPRHGKQAEPLASQHPQPTLNKQSHLPQGRITEWSLKLTLTLLQHCPVLVWQQQRPHRSTEGSAKACHKP